MSNAFGGGMFGAGGVNNMLGQQGQIGQMNNMMGSGNQQQQPGQFGKEKYIVFNPGGSPTKKK